MFKDADLGALRKITGCQEAHEIATAPRNGDRWVQIVAHMLAYMLFRTVQEEVERSRER